MKKILLLFAVLFFTATAAFSAVNVTVTFSDPTLQGALGGSNGTTIADDVAAELSKYSNMPDLARGFANSNTYASGAATMRGYQGYDLFGISIGTMMSVQAPSGDPTFYETLQDDLDSGDVYAGMGANPLVGQIGLNLGFLIDDLYMAFRFGKFDTTIGDESDDVKVGYDTSLFGVLLNYQIIAQKSILARSMLWRGVSIESGFIYSKNTTSFFKQLDTIPGSDGVGIYTVDYEIDPSIDFVIDNKSYIIPVELYTSLRLLYIVNLGVGAGFDYVAGGSTKLTLESAGEVTITDDGASNASGFIGKTGEITIDTETEADADKFRGKVMANLGVSMGPVYVDMPVTVYLDNGYSVGLSAGLVW
jgi:hypothetical protein